MEKKQDKQDQPDSQDVEAFFAKHRKEKKGKKNKKNDDAKADDNKANQASPEQEVSAPSQPPKEAPPNYDSDSSNEEKQQIVLSQPTNFVAMKEGAPENEELKAADDGFGWAKMGANAKTEVPQEEKKKPAPAGKGGPISFSRGAPQKFTRKNKCLIAQEEFPELGELGTPGGKGEAKGPDAQAAKANSATIGQFGAMAQERDGAIPQQHAPAKKPMFTGKAKLNLGGDNTVNSKQNYDFSSLKMATATSNKPRVDADGNPIPRDKEDWKGDDRSIQQRARQQAVEDEEDGFEVVTEKKRLVRKFDDDSFSGEKPQFTRGNLRD